MQDIFDAIVSLTEAIGDTHEYVADQIGDPKLQKALARLSQAAKSAEDTVYAHSIQENGSRGNLSRQSQDLSKLAVKMIA